MGIEGILAAVSAALSILMLYKGIYTAIGFFSKPKVFASAPMTRKYGVVIAARNEKNVIGLLLDSLAEQTYPSDLYKVFVVADNCTDDTAQIARKHGACVYERNCPEKARKGWALEFLFENIDRDFGIEHFDGFLFFDADNVVAKDYIEQVNNAFATGCDAVIGYRNTKNFDHNCISAHYGIHFMRSTMTFHRPRSRLGLSSHIAGTGYLLSSDLIKAGWNYSCLTDDTQATMDFVMRGKRIEFCEAAEFYDEQPYQFRVMARQRIRWGKGRMACFAAYGHRLLGGMFKQQDKTQGIGERLRKSFSCYDMFFYLLPNSMVALLIDLVKYIAMIVAACLYGRAAVGGVSALVMAGAGLVFGSLLTYLGSIAVGLLVVIREWRHFHCKKRKLIWYLITWPLFDKLYAYLCVLSLFMRVKWKPIKHDAAISIQDIEKESITITV